MRRPPLASGPRRLIAVVLVVPLLAACVFGGPPPTAVPTAGVTITTAPGETLAFEPSETSVRAAGPIALTFRNGSSLPHNLTFTSGSTAGTRTIVEPGTSDRLVLASPASGTYRFVCTIHDGMAGTLVVQPT